jgi:hypothetical protein
VPVEGRARAVAAHGGAGVGVAGGDLDVAKIDAGVEHRGDVGVSEHVRVHAGKPEAGVVGESAEAAEAVHAAAQGVEEQWPVSAVGGGAVHGSCDGRRKGDQDDLVALADDAQHAVAVLFADVVDVGCACFEYPQSEEAEEADEGEVGGVVGGARGCQRASSWRWLSPRVGDSGGTFGRRT